MRPSLTFAFAIAAVSTAVSAQTPAPSRPPVDEHLLKTFTYRNVGPFRMGARTSDIAVPQQHITNPAKSAGFRYVSTTPPS